MSSSLPEGPMQQPPYTPLLKERWEAFDIATTAMLERLRQFDRELCYGTDWRDERGKRLAEAIGGLQLWQRSIRDPWRVDGVA